MEEVVVTVYFTGGEALRPVSRAVAAPAPVADEAPEEPVRRALRLLLAGPTAGELEHGLSSFFSSETAGALERVELDAGGRLTVDFRDFSQAIPNAGSSAGSRQLLGELNATLLEHSEVGSVEYRFEGSCEAFWNWLQRECTALSREEMREFASPG